MLVNTVSYQLQQPFIAYHGNGNSPEPITSTLSSHLCEILRRFCPVDALPLDFVPQLFDTLKSAEAEDTSFDQ